ncbi:MAG: OmpA family protein [Granulosicoccus sp.]|nr:OmpA family protein [Granulosicoccus sp.]
MIETKKKAKHSCHLLVMLAGSFVATGCASVGNDLDSEFKQRFYAGAGILVSQLEPDTDRDPDVSVDESNSEGGAITLGLDVSQNISLEAHYADLGEATLTPDGSVSYQVGGISALWYGFNRIKDRQERIGLSLYGKVGVGALENSAENVEYEQVNSSHVLFGAGAEYGFDNGLAARAEVTAHESDAKYLLLGLIYRFGEPGNPGARTIEPVQEADTSVSTLGVPLSEVETIDGDSDTLAGSPDTTADGDRDGVPDSVDQCPNTAEGLPVRENGCEVFNRVIEGVTFESSQDLLTPEAIDILAGVAQTLRDYPEIKVTIEAHTDNRGSAVENLQLSRRRAVAVARFLVDQGIAGSRLKPQAFGESRPRVTNRTEEGRAANRRVEFSVFE